MKTPPSKEKLTEILRLLDLTPRDLMRTGESEYEDNDLGNPDLRTDELLDAMVKYPLLIQRPIVLAHGKARIGQPPEKILEIL